MSILYRFLVRRRLTGSGVPADHLNGELFADEPNHAYYYGHGAELDGQATDSHLLFLSDGDRLWHDTIGKADGTTDFVGDGSGLTGVAAASAPWTGVTGKPATFPPSSHTHAQSDITGLTAALGAKADLASPVFTGDPRVPTAAPGDNDTTAASTAFVQAAIAALIASAPGVLDTLDEIAAALGDDPNFATTIMSALAGKAPTSRNIATGTGLSGGGNLSADRTISLANTAVTAGNYGTASAVASFTVDAQGRLTAAGSTAIAISAGSVSGLATVATTGAWADIAGKPATFPPSAHTHTVANLSDASADGRSLISAANYAAMRDLLDLEVGVNVQAYDADLAALAGLTSAADKLPYFSGPGAAAVADFTAAGRALLDDASAAAQRATLELPANAHATLGGTANAITLTMAGVTLTAGARLLFKATSANTGATTIALNGGSAVACRTVTGVALPADYIRADIHTEATYDGTYWVLGREPEAGSNANGTYERFANGLQFCRSGVLTGDATTAVGSQFRMATAGTWTLPVSFVDTSYIVAATPTNNLLHTGTARQTSSSAVEYQIFSNTSQTGRGVRLTAIGRWF